MGKIYNELEYIRQLYEVLKEFYENSHLNNILILENLEKKIKEREIYLIEDNYIKNELDKMHQILPDLDMKYKLISSKFFIQIFRDKKSNSFKKEDDIFNESLEEFMKLKALFEEDWINKLDKPLIKICYKTLNIIQDNNKKSQLKFLRDYFQLKNIDDLYLDKLEEQLKIYSKKEDIFQIVTNCLYFISELGAKPTDFSLSLEKIIDNINDVNKIREYEKILVKYGINILEQKLEDKDYLNILSSIYLKKGSIKFILDLTPDDFRTLQELVSESEDTFLTIVEIQGMNKCSNFIHSFGPIKGIKTDKELISILIKKAHQEKTISAYFIQYMKNFGQIQDLFSQKLDKFPYFLRQIKDIIKSSNFTLSIDNLNEPYLKFIGNFENEINENKPINYETIIKLRDKVRKSKEEKESFEFNKIFVERINEIETINDLLKKIVEKGYSENITISVDIVEKNSIYYNEIISLKIMKIVLNI